MAGEPIVLDDLTVCYGDRPAVHHVSCVLPRAGLVALVGPNGGGKSTLLRAMMGWHRPSSGRVVGLGDERTRAYLPQRALIDPDFPLTVREVVEMSRYPVLGWWRRFRAEDHEAVDRALDEMGLAGLAERQLAALSGGQLQRALLARALATGAEVFLLDEPFNGLDLEATADLARRLRAWGDRGRLVIAVVHDLPLARRAFDHAILLRTHLIAAGPVEVALAEGAVAEAFGHAGAAHG